MLKNMFHNLLFIIIVIFYKKVLVDEEILEEAIEEAAVVGVLEDVEVVVVDLADVEGAVAVVGPQMEINLGKIKIF